jgi:replicative DNA helicase
MINTRKKILPYNIMAEETVLAIIINNSDSINFVSQVLTIEAFYLETHQIIYKSALILHSNYKIVDLVTLSSWLQDNNLIPKIGGLKFLTSLSEKIVNLISLKEYTNLIKDKYVRRLIINFGNEIINWGYQTNLPLEKIFNKIEKKIFKLNQKTNYTNINNTAEILTDIFLDLNKKGKNLSFSGYSSQFFDLNVMTQGFQKSDLIVLAGRPSIGKTAFSLNIALDICVKYNLPIIFFSLEMTKQQIVYRLLAIETELNTGYLKLGNLTEEEWKRINNALKNLSYLPFYIDDTPNISLTEIHFKIKKIKSQFGSIGIVIIDYLQLLESIKKTENRVQEISQITRNLKSFAREFDTPIIILSQLSRNVETRNNKRPILSDLRESGCIHLNKINNQYYSYQQQKQASKRKILFSLINSKLKYAKTFKFKFTGFKTTFNIKTKFDLALIITSNHKLFCKNFWVRLNRINKNYLIKINLSELLKKKFYFTILNEKIKKIEYEKLNKVYDFEIPQNKNFLKNCFILHNSIEQDADLVLMLYRDQYYNEKTKDENIAEVIIAKQRNGPTGTVKLKFNSYLTKFFNYS